MRFVLPKKKKSLNTEKYTMLIDTHNALMSVIMFLTSFKLTTLTFFAQMLI